MVLCTINLHLLQYAPTLALHLVMLLSCPRRHSTSLLSTPKQPILVKYTGNKLLMVKVAVTVFYKKTERENNYVTILVHGLPDQVKRTTPRFAKP